jgi:hypothetical protein
MNPNIVNIYKLLQMTIHHMNTMKKMGHNDDVQQWNIYHKLI